ncbi:lipocalin-like [Discoglossus pictus]
MKGLLLNLGLVLLCAVWAQADVPVQEDFQDDKVVGKWYSFGLASNSKWFQSKKQIMKMCTTVITPTADGNLEITITYPKMDRCEKRTMTYFKTEQPGVFTSKSQLSKGDLQIRMVETNYDEYALMHTVKTTASEVNTIVSLFGRSKELSQERLNKFTQFAREQGLTEDQILILPHTDKCMTEA